MNQQLRIPHIVATIVAVVVLSAGSSVAQPNAGTTTEAARLGASASSPTAEDRMRKLEEQIAALDRKVQPPKDNWDKLSALSGFISGILVAAIGAVVTVMYKRRETALMEAQKEKEQEDRKAALQLAQTQQETEKLNKEREIIISQAQTVRELLPSLRETDERTKRAALTLVAFLGNAELAGQLSSLYETDLTQVLQSITAMPGARSETRLQAAVALGNLGAREKASDALVDLSNDAMIDTAKRFSIADALEHLSETEKAADVNFKVVIDPKTTVEQRRDAIAALQRLNYTEKAKARLSEIANDEKKLIAERLVTIEAWSQLNDTQAESPEWTPTLLKMIRASTTSANLKQVSEVCAALGHSEEAAEILLQMASDSNLQIALRYVAVENLLKFGIERYLQDAEAKRREILREVARDPQADSSLRLKAVKEGLAAESKEENAIILRQILDSPETDPFIRLAAVENLKKLGYTAEASKKFKELFFKGWGDLFSKLSKLSKKSETSQKEPAEPNRHD